MVSEGCIALPLLGSKLDAEGMVREARIAAAVRAVLECLAAAATASFPVG